MAIIIDRQRVETFEQNHTATEIWIFEAIQGADVQGVVSDPGSQCGEYLGDAEEFIDWLKKVPVPDFEAVVGQLYAIYDDFDVFYNPSKSSLRDLAGALCAIIYDDQPL